jgi:FixJ family two-component response regulator
MDILIVEDEVVIARAMASALESRGHDVRIAGSAELALSLPRPEVLISDVQLGGLSGLDLLTEYKRQGITPRTIFVTGNPTLESCREAFRQGATEFLSKPFRLEELIQAVEKPDERALPRFEASYPAAAESIERASRDLAAFALRHRVGPTCRARMATAVAEVVKNAIEHAYPYSDGELYLDATIDERDVTVRVHDDGVGFSSQEIAQTHLASPRHDGLARAAALAEGIDLQSSPGEGASITLRFGAYYVDYDEENQVDLSELDFFTPGTSQQILDTLAVEGAESFFQVSPSLAVVIGRLLSGPDPSRIAAQVLRS